MSTKKIARKPITDHEDLLERTPDHNRAPLGQDFASAGSAVNVSATVSNRFRWLGRWVLGRARKATSRMWWVAQAQQELAQSVEHHLADPDLDQAERRAATDRTLVTTPAPQAGPHFHARLGLVLPPTVLFLRWVSIAGMAAFDAMYLYTYFLNVFEGPENPTLKDLLNPKVLSAVMVSILPTTFVLLLSETAGMVLAHRIDKSSREHAKRLLPWIDGVFAVLGLILVTWFLHEVAASRFQSAAAFAGAQGGADATTGFLTLLPWLMVLISTIVHTPRFQESLANARHQRALARFEKKSLRRSERLHWMFIKAEQAFQKWVAKLQAGLDRVGQIADSQVVRAALAGAYGPTAPQWVGSRDLAGDPEVATQSVSGHTGERHTVGTFNVTGAPATLVATVERYVHPEVLQVLVEAHNARATKGALPEIASLFATFRQNAARQAGVLDGADEPSKVAQPNPVGPKIGGRPQGPHPFAADINTDNLAA